MDITVSVEDYLSEADIAEMVGEEVRDVIGDKIDSALRYTELKTLISNAAYSTVMRMVSEQDPDVYNHLAEKTRDVIDDLSSYTVFYDESRHRDRFYYQNATPYKSHGSIVLDECVDELRPYIKERVKAVIDDKVDVRYLMYAIQDAIMDELREQFNQDED